MGSWYTRGMTSNGFAIKVQDGLWVNSGSSSSLPIATVGDKGRGRSQGRQSLFPQPSGAPESVNPAKAGIHSSDPCPAISEDSSLCAE